MDEGGLARDEFEDKLVGEQYHAEKLAAWFDGSEPVPPNVQDRTMLALDRPMPAIFTDKRPERQSEPRDRAA